MHLNAFIIAWTWKSLDCGIKRSVKHMFIVCIMFFVIISAKCWIIDAQQLSDFDVCAKWTFWYINYVKLSIWNVYSTQFFLFKCTIWFDPLVIYWRPILIEFLFNQTTNTHFIHLFNMFKFHSVCNNEKAFSFLFIFSRYEKNIL